MGRQREKETGLEQFQLSQVKVYDLSGNKGEKTAQRDVNTCYVKCPAEPWRKRCFSSRKAPGGPKH